MKATCLGQTTGPRTSCPATRSRPTQVLPNVVLVPEPVPHVVTLPLVLKTSCHVKSCGGAMRSVFRYLVLLGIIAAIGCEDETPPVCGGETPRLCNPIRWAS